MLQPLLGTPEGIHRGCTIIKKQVFATNRDPWVTFFDQVARPSRLVLGKKFFQIWFIYTPEGCVLVLHYFFLQSVTYETPQWTDLVPTAPDWPAWVEFMVNTHFGPFLGAPDVLGEPRGERLARIGWIHGQVTTYFDLVLGPFHSPIFCGNFFAQRINLC